MAKGMGAGKRRPAEVPLPGRQSPPSSSSTRADLDAPTQPLKTLGLAAFTLSGVVYMAWRTTAFNPDAPIISSIFFATELLGFVGSLVVFFVAMRRRHRPPLPAQPGLAVDVFVTTLDEDLRVVRRTLLAAVRIRYPHVTWLLDDGDRAELRQLAEELGCRYLARRSKTGAKAGNINHGLANSTGDFIALFDADHCAQPDFLDRLLGYFDDPDVAFVQTPQDYYNTGSFQHAFDRTSRSIWHEQSHFHHVLQPGRDYHGATTLCGCSCILRRVHLARIGGFPEETVTEDMHAAVRLQKLGLKSAYHDEPLAFGIAPPDFRGFLRQRLRWGEGNMQVCRIEGVPFSRALSLRQNICYLLLALAYADSWRKLVIYVAPPLTLLFEVPPIHGQPIHFFAFFLPYLLLGTLAYSEVSAGFGRIVLIETFDMARLGSGIAATWGLFRRQIHFRVSSKKLVGRLSPMLALPQVLIGALSLAGVVVAVSRWFEISGGSREATMPGWIEAALLVLCLLNLVLAMVVLRLIVRSTRLDEANFVHQVELPVRIADDSSRGSWFPSRAMSLDFMVTTGGMVQVGATVPLDLLLPDGILRVEAHCTVDPSGDRRFAFQWRDVADRDRLDQALHSGRWHRALAGRTEVGLTFLEWIGVVRMPAARAATGRSPWRPIVLRAPKDTPRLGYLRIAAGEEPAELIGFAGAIPTDETVEASSATGDHMWLTVTGPSSRPMLDEEALRPLGAMRVAVHVTQPPSGGARARPSRPDALAAD